MKKITLFLISILCIITCAIGFVACGDSTKEFFRYEKQTTTSGNEIYVIWAANTDISGDIVIPATYNGCKITLGATAFKDCKNINSVTISEGITIIQYSAFVNCSAKTMTIPTSVTRIDGSAIPNIESINYLGTKEEFKNINKYDFPNNINVICSDGNYQ